MVRAPVAQLAEATDSKPVQCEFESHLGHTVKAEVSPRPSAISAQGLPIESSDGTLVSPPFKDLSALPSKSRATADRVDHGIRFV